MKKLILIGSVLFTVIASALVSRSASVTLAWNPNCDTNILGYTVYYGTTNTTPSTNFVPSFIDDCGNTRPDDTSVFYGNYTNNVSVSGLNTTSVTVSNLVPGVTYAFTVVSVGYNVISANSDEILYTVPLVNTNYIPPAPQGLGFR